MKKIFSILVLAALILGLCACTFSGNTGATEATASQQSSFLAGFGQGDITPDFLWGCPATAMRRPESLKAY